MLRAGLVFVILFLSIAINLPNGMITRLGFDADYLMAALAAVVLTGLTVHRRLFLIVLVVFCSAAANMPIELINSWGLERDYFLATLVALVILPIGAKLSGRY